MKGVTRRRFLALLPAAAVTLAAGPAEAEDEYSMVLVDPPEWDVIEGSLEDSPLCRWAAEEGVPVEDPPDTSWLWDELHKLPEDYEELAYHAAVHNLHLEKGE